MKKTFLIVVLLIVKIYSLAQPCHCSNEEKRIMFKNKIIVCGTTDETKLDNTLVLSEITVKNCLTNKYLIDSRSDATETFAVKKFSDSLTITSLQLIPDSSMRQLMYVPFSYKVLKIASDGKPNISQSRFIFSVPKITESQKKYIDTLCLKLKSGIKKPAGIYPFDETSIYVLFLGALMKYNDCYDLFVNLGKYYTLDGAIAETKEEIPFEYITKNKSKPAHR